MTREEIINLLIELASKSNKSDGWINLGPFGNMLLQKGFDFTSTGHKKLAIL